MAALSANSTLEIVIGGSDSIVAPINNPFGTPLQDRVSSQLAVIPGFTVTSFQVSNSQPLGQILGDTYAYVATLEIVSNGTQDSSDVLGAVFNAFAAATGYNPTESAVTKVNNTSTGVTPATPAPSALDPFAAILAALENLLKNIPTIAIVIVVVIVGLVIFIVVKNPPKFKAR